MTAGAGPMTNSARISVVIPCYNAARYIGATLRSVLAQDGVALEVIVVDDGSSDGSPEVVRQGFPSVVLLTQPNQGVAAARNRGIAHATGDWVAFVDADDIWLPGKLAAQVAALQAQPETRMAYTAWSVWHSNVPEPDPRELEELQTAAADEVRWRGASGWIYPELLADCAVWTSTVLMDRTLLVSLGGFDEGLRVGEDYDLWLRASRLTPILRVSCPFALYRIHGSNTTLRAPSANHKGEVIMRALGRWGYTSPDGRVADRKIVAAGLARSWSDYAGAQLRAGDARGACRSALNAVRTHPGRWLSWKVLMRASLRGLCAPRSPAR